MPEGYWAYKYWNNRLRNLKRKCKRGTREEEGRWEMSGIDKAKYQIKQASGWKYGLAGGQAYDLW